MVSSKMSSTALIAVVLMVVVATTKVAEGQNSTPNCASKLVPCYSYINSTNPPASCCDPIKEAVTKELDCLCKLYEDPQFLAGLGINITQALKLPGYCGIPGNVSACNKASAPGSAAQPPPPVPGNGVGKIGGTGLSSLLLLWASFMLC
ncbi:hypothetical protein ACH5RR_041421 [Cinchona calisaya]|uniref:Bifunctional inhibitor/plant lipid transfer protein/seed storage helical domain-containing protein n=1 Tax=Cinchona calisaya TaxID=153742 RepID=A0ABD2XTM8_9GENT